MCRSVSKPTGMSALEPKTLAVLAGVVGLIVGSGCTRTPSEVAEFVIAVDSVIAPGTARPGTPLSIVFLGFVGPNGCYQLKEVVKEAGPQALLIQFVGVHTSGQCTQMPVALQHEETLTPNVEGNFTVEVSQPDGATLTRVIVIEAIQTLF